MPNIKQQKKRVRTAAEERLENLRYRSTIKTLTKRLADGGRGRRRRERRDRAQEPRAADRPRRRPRRAAPERRRAQEVAGRALAAGSPSLPTALDASLAALRREQRVISTSARSSSSSFASREPPFSAWSSSASRTSAPSSSAGREVPHLSRRASAPGTASARASLRRPPRQALLVEPMGGARMPRRGSSGCRRAAGSCARPGRPSGRASARRHAAPRRRRGAPHASVRVHGGDSARGATSASTSALRHLAAVRPGRELVDLARELVEIVADELGEQPARLGSAVVAVQLELLGDPAGDRPCLRRPRAGPRRAAATAFASGASFFSSPATSASVVPGAGDFEIVGDRLRVGRLPASRRLRRPRAACPRRTGPSRCTRRPRRHRSSSAAVVQLDRVGVEAAAQPRDRAVDLRPVAAGDQVGGLSSSAIQRSIRGRCGSSVATRSGDVLRAGRAVC